MKQLYDLCNSRKCMSNVGSCGYVYMGAKCMSNAYVRVMTKKRGRLHDAGAFHATPKAVVLALASSGSVSQYAVRGVESSSSPFVP